jgi:hypothetical protein
VLAFSSPLSTLQVPPAVTTAIAFVSNALPPNYAVFVDAGQTDVFASVSSKTANGFNIVTTRRDREWSNPDLDRRVLCG